MPTRKKLLSLFKYEAGKLFWKVGLRNGVKPGSEAGNLADSGRWVVTVNRKTYLRSRIIFLMLKGFLPKTIDHINRDCKDDRIENLRPASQQENCFNRSLRKKSSVKWKGVSQSSRNKLRFEVRITIKGETSHLGTFTCPDTAAMVYNQKAETLFGEFAHLNISKFN